MNKKIMLIIVLTLVLVVTGCQKEVIDSNKESEINNENQENSEEVIIDDEVATDEETLEIGSNIGDIPMDIITTDLEGNEVKLSDYKGQVIFLNFWASWCGPCQIEMPDFDDFYSENKDNNFTIFAVNAGEDLDTITSFLDENGYSFPVYYNSKTDIGKDYKVTGIPTTLIINEDYEIIGKRIGILNYEEIEQFFKEAKRED